MFKVIVLSLIVLFSSNIVLSDEYNLNGYAGFQASVRTLYLKSSNKQNAFNHSAIEGGAFLGFDFHDSFGFEASYINTSNLLMGPTDHHIGIINFSIPSYVSVKNHEDHYFYVSPGVSLLTIQSRDSDNFFFENFILPSCAIGWQYSINNSFAIRIFADWKNTKDAKATNKINNSVLNYENMVGLGVGISYTF